MVALKRREKMACQRSMTQKKGEKKGVTMSQKKRKRKRERDRDDSREKSHYLKE
jgi:hypothetical protein